MVKVDEVKQFVDFVSNKLQSGSVSPKEFNLAARFANYRFFSKRWGLPEDYQPGQPIPKQAFELTQTIKDDLRVFKETVDIIVDNDGKASIPTDYVHKTAINYRKVVNDPNGVNPPTTTMVPVETIDDDKFTERKRAKLKTPTRDYPICNFNNTYIEVAPTDLGKIQLVYLRLPADPVWAFTTANTIPLYNAANSTDFEWPAISMEDVASFILSYVGINLREPELQRYAESFKGNGE